MSKLRQTFTLEEHHREIIRTQAMVRGMTQSQFIRYLLEHAQMRLPEPNGNDSLEDWKYIRSAFISSPNAMKILQTLKTESDSGRVIKNIRELAQKAGLDYNTVREVLCRMLISGILTKMGRGKYMWTYLGVFCLPEYSQMSSKSDSVVTGGWVGVLIRFFVDYDGTVNFLRTNLKISKRAAEEALAILFSFTAEFMAWLREYVFAIHGIHKLDDIPFYRRQLINFLSILCDLILQEPDIYRADVKLLSRKITAYKKRQLRLYDENII